MTRRRTPSAAAASPRSQATSTAIDHPRHVAQDAESERRREVVGQHELAVGGVVDRLPGDDADGDDRQQREQPDDGDRTVPGAPSRSGAARAGPRRRRRRAAIAIRWRSAQAPDQQAAERASTSPATTPPTDDRQHHRGDGAPNTSVLIGPPRAFWSPSAWAARRPAPAAPGGRRPRGTPASPSSHGERPDERDDERARQIAVPSAGGAVRRVRRPRSGARPPASRRSRLRAGDPVSPPRACERSSTLSISVAVGREVAAPERRLGELEVGVRVVDQPRHVGRQPAARRRRRPRRRDGPGVGGRTRASGVGPGLGRRRRAPPPCAASSRSAPRPACRPQTTVVGLATTIRWNSGNADEVDWRYTGWR